MSDDGDDELLPWRRYATPAMTSLVLPQRRYQLWRRLWLTLAEEQQRLGLPISDAQLEALRHTLEDIDYTRVAHWEELLQHDVMAHIKAWGEQCPVACGIIHLGATSCFVTDNSDLIIMSEALLLLRQRLQSLLDALAAFAQRYAALPCVAWTHFQPAQPTTVGKRAALWLQDLAWDGEALDQRQGQIAFLGVKGATGTQASFLTLFGGDDAKVVALEQRVAARFGFARVWPVTGQTYPRKWDHLLLQSLAGLAVSAHKIATDLRLLAHLNEVSEPRRPQQVGSSAMPHKQNPILSERLCALARFLMSLEQNGAATAANQWLERSLDDSANRRLTLPQAYLCADALLTLLQRLVEGLAVDSDAIAAHMDAYGPLLSMEQTLMESVLQGGDRQEEHERLRRQAAQKNRGLAVASRDVSSGRAAQQVIHYLQQLGRWRPEAGGPTSSSA